jgi:hypothetical protein
MSWNVDEVGSSPSERHWPICQFPPRARRSNAASPAGVLTETEPGLFTLATTLSTQDSVQRLQPNPNPNGRNLTDHPLTQPSERPLGRAMS